ncbi:MRP4 37S ribosomal protein MRP4 [Candida maltosa Xu316]
MIRSTTRSTRRVFTNLSRPYSTEPAHESEQPLEHKLSYKELREQAIAEALAREEEAILKAKQIREMTQESKNMISTLNKTPVTLINERISKLSEDLSQLPQDKVKQLDEELREFLSHNVILPEESAEIRPWIQSQKNIPEGESAESNGAHSSTISSQYTSQFPNLKPTPDYKSYSTQELYLRQLNHTRLCGKLGSRLGQVYRPQKDINNPPKYNDATITKLMAAGCHLGHATASFRQSMQPFIYGIYDKVHIIDLNKTLEKLTLACKVIEGVVEKGGIVLYVGTYKNNSTIHEALVKASQRSHGYYVNKRWIPGTITNYTEITRQYADVKTKMDIDMKEKTLDIKNSENIIKPDLVVLLNPVENRNCIEECISGCIPTIGLCDSDMEPSLLTYPIPCNDDSVRSVSLMLGIMSKAAESGLKKRIAAIEELDNKGKANQIEQPESEVVGAIEETETEIEIETASNEAPAEK